MSKGNEGMDFGSVVLRRQTVLCIGAKIYLNYMVYRQRPTSTLFYI